MIPKKIHYCWFGGNPLPESAKKCIESWKRYLPDYEITEWNEQNFDVNSIPYTAEAYAAKKYAFVSDYARFKILYDHGGIYFDTDVEVIKPMDDIIARGPYMGFEINPSEGSFGAVNPGLGFGAEAGMPIFREALNVYQSLNFRLDSGDINYYAVVRITTDILARNGLKQEAGIQHTGGFYIYPATYFNPLDDATGRLTVTDETASIHWFSKTWLPPQSEFRTKCVRLLHRLFGTKFTSHVRKLISK